MHKETRAANPARRGCKNEYRAGFTTCPDCGINLVENITESPILPLCSFDNREVENKFCSYLEYSKIEFTRTKHDEMDFLAVDKSVMSDAVKALRAFCEVEEGIFLKKQID